MSLPFLCILAVLWTCAVFAFISYLYDAVDARLKAAPEAPYCDIDPLNNIGFMWVLRGPNEGTGIINGYKLFDKFERVPCQKLS